MCASRLPGDRRYLSVSDVRQLAETAPHFPAKLHWATATTRRE